MGKQEVAEVRNYLIAKGQELGAKGSTSHKIIEAVRKEHPDAVKRASRYLEDIAMLRLLSQARDTRPNSVSPLQLSFIDTLKLPIQVAVSLEDGNQGFKNIEDADLIEEIAAYSKKLEKPSRKSRRKTDLDILVDHYRPFYSATCRTLRDCMAAENVTAKRA
ncbi:hypothetical protein EOA23_12625 [Mesorhizobium sp. M2A.F.Ca.ET.042.01.1.1]|uniref:hypothetical protein n=1 Tax=Mesorhizobium sp. M2A.F.Ca.ET.042.01.1.1 TaxID=2496745 RepID=UPI000FCCA0C8|nr:hypothetical protein [Mesorhizobium sp. M2A.F.Ca.ET.042.01.1.1]RUX30067.1 hypothetical protein EOA23_12625 [Mesorhizobium sp. M2A.F.Ca.ET.042.01.1.1]